MGKAISRDVKDGMISAYLSGASGPQAASLFGRSSCSCYRALEAAGIDRRSLSEAIRTYPVNKRHFDPVDTEEGAYWLGFIAADGCVDTYGRAVIIGLSRRDRHHIEEFVQFLSPGRPIRDYVADFQGDEHEMSEVRVWSESLCELLSRYNIVPAKTHTVEAPDNLPDHLYRHYWRGVVDGDGSIGKYERVRKTRIGNDTTVSYWQLLLTGNLLMLKGFADFVEERTGYCRKVIEGNSTHRIGYDHQAALKVIKILYSDCEIALDRKLSKAQKAMKEVV